ncbi:MAG: sigma-70 family RNA polymerase sigma factor, partial [Cyanobacteria bacterium J06632_22]
DENFSSLLPSAVITRHYEPCSMSADEPKGGLTERGSSPTGSLNDAPDDVLIAALRQGHKAALGVLYQRYGRLVYTIAFRVVNNEAEAEDLTQEVFLILWQKQTYDPSRSSLSRFLSTVTRNRAIDRVRSRGIRYRILKGMAAPPAPSENVPIEQASQGERSEQVRAALQQIPEPQRQLLALAYYDGLSQSEIARHTNLPLGTVKSRMRQGLLKLRAILQDLMDDTPS